MSGLTKLSNSEYLKEYDELCRNSEKTQNTYFKAIKASQSFRNSIAEDDKKLKIYDLTTRTRHGSYF